jgi:hypothetical protein
MTCKTYKTCKASKTSETSKTIKKTEFNYLVIGGGVPSEKQGKIAVWPRSISTKFELGSCFVGL